MHFIFAEFAIFYLLNVPCWEDELHAGAGSLQGCFVTIMSGHKQFVATFHVII